MARGCGHAGHVHGSVQHHVLHQPGTLFKYLHIHIGVHFKKLWKYIGKHLHASLYGNAKAQFSMILLGNLFDFLGEVCIDGQDLLCCFHIFFACVSQCKRFCRSVKNRSSQIGFHQFNHLAQGRL